ncbi:ABC transporter permease [Mycoplasmopsis felis]|uniref:ABC transporter permease n=1 Tax=Mycoplasmopsis felis TaxID=33923 RepID=UPI002AFF2A91|nr:ABC transporter permease [Mycoplasmopsis felis]WQQ08162.1 ABC transporter permease [Mycoplasmopsis felis]WQQ10181.1 ABC transporter permease [Mycoplasmopsis felis]
MLKYILQRIGFAILTLLIIVIVVFLLTAHFTENPFLKQATDLSGNNNGSSQNTASKLRTLFEKSVDYHFLPLSWKGQYNEYKDQWLTYKLSPVIRFGYWLGDLFTNKEQPFGLPFDDKLFSQLGVTSIPHMFFKFLRFSVIITVPAFIISAILGIFLGILSGYKRGTWIDASINVFALFFIALPSFVIAPILITILLSANVTPNFILPDDSKYTTNQIITSWIPPISIIVLGSLSGYITFTRNQVISVLTSNYVLIAKSKGLGTVEIFFKYVLRNISIPLAALLIPSYIGLLSGGIVIESYWRVPGTSQIIAQSFPNGEINIIMFNTFFFTLLGVFTTILVDVSYTFLDPRIKYSTKPSIFILVWKNQILRNKEFQLLKQKGVTNDI